jgi:ribosome-associated protein
LNNPIKNIITLKKKFQPSIDFLSICSIKVNMLHCLLAEANEIIYKQTETLTIDSLPMEFEPMTTLNAIAQTIFDKKGFNILVLDVRGISTMTDYFVIAEGSADKHVQALARSILNLMAERGEKPTHMEGLRVGDWVVLDFLNIIIHLFMPGLRERYSLEQVWQEGKIVSVNIVLPEKAKKPSSLANDRETQRL